MIQPKPELQRILEAKRRELLQIAGVSQNGVFRLMQKIERRMIREMGKNGGKVTPASVNRMTAIINRMVLESLPELGAWMEAEFPKGALNGLETQARMLKAAFGVTEWSAIPVDRVRDTFLAFEEGIASRRLLKITDPKQLARWSGQWTQHWTGTMEKMQGRFVEGMAKGESWSALARDVRGPLDSLNLRGRMSSDAFANGFTRAKLTEIANVASTRAASASGLEKFINLGVSDERQSTICRGASKAGAMTLAEWDASEYGRPPRHVLNCRCELAAVPEFAEEEILQEVGA